ncbi:GNAT family N-acetyltransferase [Hyphomonas johnsonii]|jgi:RimJ/RimL family protein N-acetyltransferase|uniref:Acetyltransferase n=1 Tax=Hyphomonas johnsonii MHS-2 TaxID=1280950 RepID=A0A059FLW7_9PROT|nr:GNAT family N-acetyltransferase [Hyphomonas johnsonii]KCZ91587.1 acetyltransferase [Hyphomonas johnsonii MHS-2]
MAIGPTLETGRLILRPPRAEDFGGFCALMDDAASAEFIGGVQTPSVVWRSLCTMTGAWTISGFSMFSVIEKATGNWIGRLGPWRPEGWPGNEVGWGLLPAAWGKGYAQEGAAAAMDYAVDILGWDEIIHCIDPMNAPSIKVAERLGSAFLRKAPAPEPFAHIVWDLYGQSADQWRTRRIKPA